MLIDHIGLAISNYDRSKAFYSQCLAPLGIELIVEIDGWAGFGRNRKAELWFGPDASPHPPMHIAFVAENRDMVEQFYQAALAAGGRDNGAPGIREIYHPDYYGAFVIDPDGHNIEAVCHHAGVNSDGYQIKTGYIPGLVGRAGNAGQLLFQTLEFQQFFRNPSGIRNERFRQPLRCRVDCIWSALIDNDIVATITIDGVDADSKGAHLRWFIAADAARGKGIGGRLIGLAMDFCRQKNYDHVYLHTFKGLEAARRLYESAGFKLMETRSGDQWGTRVDEQRYEARL